MTLYLDTSCLAKLFFDEHGSEWMENAIRKAKIIATSVIAYPEMCSVLARRRHEGSLTEVTYKNCLLTFRQHWMDVNKVHAGEGIILEAGELALKYKLRGMDALHLASSIYLRSRNATYAFQFLSADIRLNAAAKKEGFRELFPE